MSLLGPAAPPGPVVSGSSAPGPAASPGTRYAGWPLTALLMLYPLWWALGMGTLIVFVLALPMAAQLYRRRPILVPPGFGIWLLFLLWVFASTVMLSQNPPGTLPDSVSGRAVSVAFNLAGYLSATVILLYAGNLTEEEFPRRRLIRQLGFFFVIVLVGGLLGTFAPRFGFTSVVEMLLPGQIAQNGFVRSLVHPASAQLQEVLGFETPRPAAPFGYTNTWGNALALLLGWFVLGWIKDASPGRRVVGVILLGLAAIPVVYSLNRGLWVGPDPGRRLHGRPVGHARAAGADRRPGHRCRGGGRARPRLPARRDHRGQVRQPQEQRHPRLHPRPHPGGARGVPDPRLRRDARRAGQQQLDRDRCGPRTAPAAATRRWAATASCGCS